MTDQLGIEPKTGNEGPPAAPEISRELNEFQILRDLPPIDTLSDEALEKELIKTRNDPDHPFNLRDDRFHQAAVDRVSLIYGRKYSPEKMQAQNQKEGAALRKEMEERQAQIDQEKAEKEIKAIEDKLEAQLIQEGKPVKPGDAKALIKAAQTTYQGLMKEKVLAGDFTDFLEETGEGNLLENLKLFSDISALQQKYLQWKSKPKE